MKKIFALAVSMILMISILIPIASSSTLLPVTSSNFLGLISFSSPPVLITTSCPENTVIIEKTIKDGENWVNLYNADPGEIIRFRIKVTYHDWDGESGETNGYMLTYIILIDRLPSNLIYLGNSNYDEKSISPDEKAILWEFNDIQLLDNESLIVEFDAVGNDIGEFVNNADVTALECCNQKYLCNTTRATVIISNGNNSTNTIKYKDVDEDNKNETAIDENKDLSDGYEVYKDPDNSSDNIISIDGDNDNKIDHFIDIDNDSLPERYWDPDDDILTEINIIDVDYDGTKEWVYDSDEDFDGIPDKYYDPDDNQIHEYVVYELTVNVIGNGNVQKNPDGILFLEGFNVQLTAIAFTGENFINYTGDITSNNTIITITMDANKNVTATFTKLNIFYILTINIIGDGTVNPTTGNNYPAGTIVDITATPNTGWQFDSWSGDLIGSTNPTNITMDTNKSITATFTEINISYYTLTINIIGEGTVNPTTGNKYLEGTIVNITATPDTGWKFTRWTGDLNLWINPTTITMNSDKNITTIFTADVIEGPSVNITKPENNHLYLFNIGFKSTEYKPHIIGPINIKVQAESDKGIAKVEFYLNNVLKQTADLKPYSWIWFLKPGGDEENYTIKVIAYDLDGNTNTDSINVVRSAFNPILNHKKLILGLVVGGVIASLLLRNRGTDQDGVIPVEPDDNDTYDTNKIPIIDTGGPYTGIVGKPVYFDASGSYDPDGDLLTYIWNFGDGNIGAGAKQNHTYAKTGNYTVKLTVTDSQGDSDTETFEIEIKESSKHIGEDIGDLFWYIVLGLALAITIAVALLYLGGKLYV